MYLKLPPDYLSRKKLQPDWTNEFQDQGHPEKQENIIEDELLVKVPGSAYSGGKGTNTGNEVLEESKA